MGGGEARGEREEPERGVRECNFHSSCHSKPTGRDIGQPIGAELRAGRMANGDENVVKLSKGDTRSRLVAWLGPASARPADKTPRLTKAKRVGPLRAIHLGFLALSPGNFAW